LYNPNIYLKKQVGIWSIIMHISDNQSVIEIIPFYAYLEIILEQCGNDTFLLTTNLRFCFTYKNI